MIEIYRIHRSVEIIFNNNKIVCETGDSGKNLNIKNDNKIVDSISRYLLSHDNKLYKSYQYQIKWAITNNIIYILTSREDRVELNLKLPCGWQHHGTLHARPRQ